MRRILPLHTRVFASCCLAAAIAALVSVGAQQTAIAGGVSVSGELRQWHKVTLTLDGPQAAETDIAPNPFLDYRLTATFTHESGSPVYTVPGYFAADGNAAQSSATAGNKWRVHVTPDKTGRWSYRIAFVAGKGVAVSQAGSDGRSIAPLHGRTGMFQIAATDKRAPDFRGRGRLQYAGRHYLQFAGSGEYFLKLGADSPETLLAYTDFDGTIARKPQVPLRTFAPHVWDWRAGDPTWKDGKGKGLVGALDYLASKGVNSISFLPYNAGGDGDNVWPFVSRDDKFHYDVSKLDQWQIVFDYAQQKGIYLHFKLQENEIDDNRRGNPVERAARRAEARSRKPREFFHAEKIPFWEMDAADELVGNGKHDNSRYCFAKPNDSYLVYLPDGGAAALDLTNAAGQYTVEWFDPRSGGPLRRGTIPGVNGGAEADLGMPPDSPGEDWLVLVRRR